jgi:hypothetical protein
MCGALRCRAEVGEAGMARALADVVRWAVQEATPPHWETVCLGVKALALMAVQKDEEGLLHHDRLTEAKACKVAVAALREALDQSEEDAVNESLRLVWKLMNQPVNFRELVELGATELVKAALHRYGCHRRDLCLSACAAVAQLLKEERGKSVLLKADTTTCEDVLMIAHSFPQDIEVMERVCQTLWSMSEEQGARRRLLAFNAGVVLIGAMQAFPRHRPIHFYSCAAMTQLAVGSDPWVRSLVEHKAPLAVFRVLTNFPRDAELLQRALRALGCLSAHKACRRLLRDLSTALVAVLENVMELGREELVDECLGLILTQVIEPEAVHPMETAGLVDACVRALQGKPKPLSRLSALLAMKVLQEILRFSKNAKLGDELMEGGLLAAVAVVMLPLEDDVEAIDTADSLLNLLGLEMGIEELPSYVPLVKRLTWALRKPFRRR